MELHHQPTDEAPALVGSKALCEFERLRPELFRGGVRRADADDVAFRGHAWSFRRLIRKVWSRSSSRSAARPTRAERGSGSSDKSRATAASGAIDLLARKRQLSLGTSLRRTLPAAPAGERACEDAKLSRAPARR